MPDKLTDNEITIKALKEILVLMLCEGDLRKTSTISHAIDLINRLQSTIEDLNIRLTEERHRIDYIDKSYNEIKTESYKECIEKAKKELAPVAVNVSDMCEILDNLLKELLVRVNESKNW